MINGEQKTDAELPPPRSGCLPGLANQDLSWPRGIHHETELRMG